MTVSGGALEDEKRWAYTRPTFVRKLLEIFFVLRELAVLLHYGRFPTKREVSVMRA